MPILDWFDKDKVITRIQQVPYHLLQAVPEFDAGERNGNRGQSDNMLIQGDNLSALKSLLPLYAGKVRCIYIDPPYNTGSAFEHYDDNLEHSVWLSMMRPRLELLRELLSVDGFLLCQIDDTQGAYLKVLCDEVFGRNNYQMTLYVQVRYAQKTLKQDMKYHKQIEHVLVYSASSKSVPYQPKITETGFEKFTYQINEKGNGKVESIGGRAVTIFQCDEYEIITKNEGWIDGLKGIWASGSILDGNSSGRFFRDYLTGRSEKDGLGVLYKVPDIGGDGRGFRYFTGPRKASATKGMYYQGVPIGKRLQTTQTVAQPIPNFHDYAGSFGNCRLEGGVSFRSGKKPEAWLQYLLERFSSEGDIVLDCFLGSGSTAAVALKMGRRFIGIEMGDHAEKLCQPRLKKVVEGEQSGISEAVEWKGGSGFRFYRLGEPVFDEYGHIRTGINFSDFAQYLWFLETGTPMTVKPENPFLGEHNGVGYYLLYNGVLGDRRPQGGNVLTRPVLDKLPAFNGRKVIYGESCRLGDARLEHEGIEFKQIPYEISYL